MLTLLINIFVKNKNDVNNPKVREAYGILCGGYGIFLNIVLFIGKYIAGILSSSIAMTADAFNNLSDAGSSLISVIGFKLSGKKPDPKHPFGHGRIEYLSGLIVSALIVIMGYELTVDSFAKIKNPGDVSFSVISVVILAASILVKFYMAFYSRRIGKKIESETLLATSTDSLSDTISTFVVLISTIVAYLTNIRLDGWCGMLVGILIIIAGIKAASETISPLLGQPPAPEFIAKIEDIVRSHEEIVGIHDLIVHDYGPGRVMVTLHAEVPSNGDINELHDVIDTAENELFSKLNCHATIHMDPIEVGNEKVEEIKEIVKEVIKNCDENMNFHDFRVVVGPTHTNLIFDVVASYNLKKSDEEIANDIFALVNKENPAFRCVINVDRDYTGA